jgi:hypothetical protein
VANQRHQVAKLHAQHAKASASSCHGRLHIGRALRSYTYNLQKRDKPRHIFMANAKQPAAGTWPLLSLTFCVVCNIIVAGELLFPLELRLTCSAAAAQAAPLAAAPGLLAA